jgi:hypothetical protein
VDSRGDSSDDSTDEGPDDKGPDDEGPDDEGPDDEGPDDEGPALGEGPIDSTKELSRSTGKHCVSAVKMGIKAPPTESFIILYPS